MMDLEAESIGRNGKNRTIQPESNMTQTTAWCAAHLDQTSWKEIKKA